MKAIRFLPAFFLIIVSSFSVALNMAHSEDAIESAETIEPEEPSIHDPMRFVLELLSKACHYVDSSMGLKRDVFNETRKRYSACLSEGRAYIASNLIDPASDPRFVEFTRAEAYCKHILYVDDQAKCLKVTLDQILDSKTLSTPTIAMTSCDVLDYGHSYENECLLEAIRLWGNPKVDPLLDLCDGVSDDDEKFECMKKALNLIIKSPAPKFDG